MAISAEQIDLWRVTPSEHQRLEFKEARTGLDQKKMYEYCVALANEGGGYLVLGIADQPPRAVVGTSAVGDPCGMAEKLFRKLGFRVDVEEVNHSDGRVVVLSVPARPTGTAYHLDGRYLMRSGGSLVAMTEDQLRKIFGEGEPGWLEQHSKSGLAGADVLTLLDTQALFELLQLPRPATDDGYIERLVDERLIDEIDGSFAIRRMGAVLVAKDLGAFSDVERKAPRVVVYDGVSKLKTKMDSVITRGYAVGFQDLVKYIQSQLPQNEVIEDALRRAVKLVPEEVVRELVANALIHQDFAIPGASVMVEIYDDRVELSNPGAPIVEVSRFIDGYQSRNERLAGLMRRFGICEEKSSGIDRVVATVEAYQLPAPDFRSTDTRTMVTIYGQKPFDEMDRAERIRACYQHCALKYVMGQPMTNHSLRERFGLPAGKSVIVSQVISATCSEGLIKADERVGTSKRFARYLPFWA